MNQNITRIQKTPTGMRGFDEITEGGLPKNRVTVVMGGPGAGKTVFALQTLVNGALDYDEPGILVAFEENAEHIKMNAAGFAWPGGFESPDEVTFMDAQLRNTVLDGTDFDLQGLLAILSAQVEETGARRVVFDGIDVLLGFLDNPLAVRREVFRLRDWVLQNGISGVITAKTNPQGAEIDPHYDQLQFMADCVVQLSHNLVGHTAMRGMRVSKYRGTSHSSNEFPFTITSGGIDVAVGSRFEIDHQVSTERVSTGVDRLDAMMDGGYFRGTSVLISGAPGTAKTTLAGAFTRKAAQNGERTLYVSFDEDANQIVRNLQSVGLDLEPFVTEGVIDMLSLRARGYSPETHVVEIINAAQDHGAENLVIDPISVFTHFGDTQAAEDAALRLIDFAKSAGITIVSTTLLATKSPEIEATPVGLSTIADTWLHLSYQKQGGERNRALSVIKSRGMKHSNQVRELLLDDDGVTLAPVYTGGGEVLMGTLRWEKEQREKAEAARQVEELELEKQNERLALDEIDMKLEALRHEQQRRKSELEKLDERQRKQRERREHFVQELARRRGHTRRDKADE
ncbi:circadian clock protein KaiC [Persicimonas caeni]|uniref:non-specific serine/threonine protein kinase n=1 Tax=Persicimonas caeni TaxID=2292766 RepID=A0A4Y6PW96_PERCE|nr:circadian clock protein KaiC [Persicimonas caeni]QDG52399.1 circadian clock protein KaiC [Persicimonas caeni]QED33621.1 circadian clock protein KaiC [Persicimonas caeni]